MINVSESGDASIYLFGQIGGYEITAEQVRLALEKVEKGSKLEVHIHSPGGSVFEGVAIASLLSDYDTTAVVDGLAASIASVIALSCDRVEMVDGSQLMIHNPWSMAVGDSDEMRKTAEMLDKVRDQMAAIYRKRLPADSDQDPVALMSEETWMTPDEAIEMGFCDGKRERLLAAACLIAPEGIDADKSPFLVRASDEMTSRLMKEVKGNLDQLAENSVTISKLNESVAAKDAELKAIADEAEKLRADIASTDAQLIAAKAEAEAAQKELAEALTHRDIAAKAAAARSEPIASDELPEAVTPSSKYEEYKAITDRAERLAFFAKHRNAILNSTPKA